MTDERVFEIQPSAYAYGGEVFGRLPDGRAVFIPFGIPEERLRVRLVEEKRGYTRAELIEVIDPSPKRIEPVCIHYGDCGGCHYQHMPYELQLTAKEQTLIDQLKRIGQLEDPPLEKIVPAGKETYYRNHVQFHLDAQGNLGYHRPRSEQVLPIQECHLPEKNLNAIWPRLDFEVIPGLQRIGIRLGSDDELQILLESHNLETPQLSVIDMPASVIHSSPAGELVLAGGQAVLMELLGRTFQVSAGAFFQVHTEMTEVMVTHIIDTLPSYKALTPEITIIDAYCGVGTFSAFLAPHVGRLIGIEASGIAVDDYIVNLDEFDNVEIYEAPVGKALPQINVQPDIMLVDPPRSGVDRSAMEALLKLKPNVLCYVSCDPATLARDVRRLIEGGYRLAKITPFDLFPQTYHIESISFWTRN